MRTNDNRRRSARQAAVKNRAPVAWGEGANLTQFDATVLDISHSGNLMLVSGRLRYLPPTVWIRLDSPKVTEWVQATVVRTSTVWSLGLFLRRHVVQRLHRKFDRACPYDLYIAVTHGCALDEKVVVPLPEDSEARYWW